MLWALPKILLFFLSAILICAGLKNTGFNGGNISLLLDQAINNTTITFAKNKSLNTNYIAIALGAIFFAISISIKINAYFNFLLSVLAFLKKLLTYLLMTFKPILFLVLKNKKNNENEKDRYNKKNMRYPSIRWQNPVHEILRGQKNFVTLPELEEWSIYHQKRMLVLKIIITR